MLTNRRWVDGYVWLTRNMMKHPPQLQYTALSYS